jgi:hypothetical protein
MVRVIFLLSQCDHTLNALVEQAVSGEVRRVLTPNGKIKKVPDREMVQFRNEIRLNLPGHGAPGASEPCRRTC